MFSFGGLLVKLFNIIWVDRYYSYRFLNNCYDNLLGW